MERFKAEDFSKVGALSSVADRGRWKAVVKKVSQPLSRVLSWTIIHLGDASPHASSGLPESSASHT